MRFEGNSGSRVARVVLDANHAEALADGIRAACKELHARAVSL